MCLGYRVREDSSCGCTPDLANLRKVLRAQRASSAGAAAAGAPLCASLAGRPEAHLALVGTSERRIGGITEDPGVQQHVPAHATSLLSKAEQAQSLTADGDDAVRLGDHHRALQLYTAAMAACCGATESPLSTEPASTYDSQPSSSHLPAYGYHNAEQQEGLAACPFIDVQAADCTRGQSTLSTESHHSTGPMIVKEMVANMNGRTEHLTVSGEVLIHSRRAAPDWGVIMGWLHLKRAACHVHMGAHGAAVADCTVALHLAGGKSAASAPDSNAVRVAALLQRGLAAEVLEKSGHSKRDFLAALSLDPSNRMVRRSDKFEPHYADVLQLHTQNSSLSSCVYRDASSWHEASPNMLMIRVDVE